MCAICLLISFRVFKLKYLNLSLFTDLISFAHYCVLSTFHLVFSRRTFLRQGGGVCLHMHTASRGDWIPCG